MTDDFLCSISYAYKDQKPQDLTLQLQLEELLEEGYGRLKRQFGGFPLFFDNTMPLGLFQVKHYEMTNVDFDPVKNAQAALAYWNNLK